MPIPELHFEDERKGLPRQPVPVRFACIVADWSPQTIAGLASGAVTGFGGPLLDVHAFNSHTNKAGDVTPKSYATISESLSGNLYDDLQILPANHFVWSDDLADVFLIIINDLDGHEEARQCGIKLHWNPELRENTSVIDECPDLSSLVKDKAIQNVISFNNDIWSISYNGQQVNIPDQKGIHYIKILLLHPQVEYSIQDLYIEVNPPPPTPDVNLQEFMPTDEDSDESTGISIGGLGDAGETIDAQARQEYTARITAIKRDIEIATETGNNGRALELQDQVLELTKHLSAATGFRGQSRAVGSTDEKIRKSIRIAIDRTIKHISKFHPDLGRHLKTSIKTGYSCSYQPTTETRWQS